MNRGRKSLVILLLASFLLAWMTRAMVYDQRQSIDVEKRRSAKRLAGMDTFALGLILGGLRGPLVMFLWTSIESQKTEKNLENIDTKIELVRRLQPEFASVHIFQIWNKAYNLSVQVASLPNKYSMILSALDYAHNVDAEQRDNLNILVAMAEVYFQKLGQSSEKNYYIARVRQDSKPRPAERKNARQDAAWQRTEHETLLDEKGFLLPELLLPRADRPKPKPDSTMEYDGSELQFLRQFNTKDSGGFPYGVSPLALGYNYYKRSAAIANITGQKHIYVSDSVIDSRPGIVLRNWADEEMERGRRLEITTLGKQVTTDERWDLEPITAALPPDAKLPVADDKARKAIEEALFSYGRAAEAADVAAVEFDKHAKNQAFAENPNTYVYHMDTASGVAAIARADHAWLESVAAANGLGGKASPKSELIELYQRALERLYYAALRNDVDNEVAAAVYPTIAKTPSGEPLNKATIKLVDPRLYEPIYEATTAHYKKLGRLPVFEDAIREYSGYIDRARQRMAVLKK